MTKYIPPYEAAQYLIKVLRNNKIEANVKPGGVAIYVRAYKRALLVELLSALDQLLTHVDYSVAIADRAGQFKPMIVTRVINHPVELKRRKPIMAKRTASIKPIITSMHEIPKEIELSLDKVIDIFKPLIYSKLVKRGYSLQDAMEFVSKKDALAMDVFMEIVSEHPTIDHVKVPVTFTSPGYRGRLYLKEGNELAVVLRDITKL